MKVRYIKNTISMCLTENKIYEVLSIEKGWYLYPEAEGADDLQLWLNKGSTYEANVVPRDDICIIKHGLKIPIDAENYESFVSKMQVSESKFRQVFIG